MDSIGSTRPEGTHSWAVLAKFVVAVHRQRKRYMKYTTYIGAASKEEAEEIMREAANNGHLGTVYKAEFVATSHSLGNGSSVRIKVGGLDHQIAWLLRFCDAWDVASEYAREWLCEIYSRFCWDHGTPNISADEAAHELICRRERSQ